MRIHMQPLAALQRDQIAMELAKLSSERLDAAAIDNVYNAMIVHRAEMYGAARLDANETMVLELMLQQMRARTADIIYPEFKARRFVPITSEVDPGAESWAYQQWDRVGMAKIIANYADDIPKVATFSKKFTQFIETLALGYDWSWLDMQRTAKAGVPLKARKAEAVRQGFEQRIEEIAAIGIKDTGATGLLNNTNVPAIGAAAAAGGGHTTAWAGGDKTPQEVLDDLHAMEDGVITNTLGAQAPDTMLLPLAQYRYISKTSLITGNQDPKNTILRVFLDKATNIRSIDWWLYLSTANSGAPRAIAYKRDPIVVHLELPMEQQEMPPQAKGLAMEVNSVGRIGGVAYEYPLAAIYMNGI